MLTASPKIVFSLSSMPICFCNTVQIAGENSVSNLPSKLSFGAVQVAWLTLVVNVIVILQGAVVRATGSGAGCGRHWPTCNGEVVPLDHTVASMIEFSHRLLSLVALICGLILLIVAIRSRKNKTGFLVFSAASFFFLIIEALLGAATVLFGLTGENISTARGLMVSFHLMNSLLLVGSLSLAVLYSNRKNANQAQTIQSLWPLQLNKQPLLATILGLGLLGMLFLMFSGGIAAMGNTMFPSETLQEGLAADFDPESHPLVRLRILHPLIAIFVGIYLFISLGLAWMMKPVEDAKRVAKILLGVYIFQLLIGTLNLALLAPIVLQLLHLGTAVAAFGLLSTLVAYALGGEASTKEARELKNMSSISTTERSQA